MVLGCLSMSGDAVKSLPFVRLYDFLDPIKANRHFTALDFSPRALKPDRINTRVDQLGVLTCPFSHRKYIYGDDNVSAFGRQMQKCRRYTVKRPDDARNTYVHSASPFLSRITFHWVTDLLSRGYHAPLELHDLGQLPHEETTRNQFERFRDIYENERVTVLRYLISLA